MIRALVPAAHPLVSGLCALAHLLLASREPATALGMPDRIQHALAMTQAPTGSLQLLHSLWWRRRSRHSCHLSVFAACHGSLLHLPSLGRAAMRLPSIAQTDAHFQALH